MNRFHVPAREEVTPQNQINFDNLKKALGMVPNLYATIAYSSNGLSRYLGFQGAKTSLTNREKEAVNLVVSQVNGCTYCQSAHTFLAGLNGFSPEDILHIRQGSSSNEKLHALVALAKAITATRGRVNDQLLDEFFAAGYDKENLVDLVLQVSDKIAMNYLHNITGIPIDFPEAEPIPETAVV
jgi:AhpD family alkylhydroperoxidase